MIVEVAFLPGAVVEADRKVAIVVDALRASSTIVAMFDAGASDVIVAAETAEALTIAAEDRSRYLVCGERNGLRPAGFDHGNSPTEATGLVVAGRRIVLSTSNGTRALHAVANARLALIGTGRNGPAVASHALSQALATSSDLVVVCAGDEQGTIFSLEDCFFAGYLVELIAAQRAFTWPVDESSPRAGDPTCWVLDESALAARRLYRSYLSGADEWLQPSLESVRAAFCEARNGMTLPRIGYGKDLDYCAAVGCSTVIPRLTRRDGRFVLLDDARC